MELRCLATGGREILLLTLPLTLALLMSLPELSVDSSTPVPMDAPSSVDAGGQVVDVPTPSSSDAIDYTPEFIPAPEVYNDNTFDRLTGDGSIPEPDEIRQKPSEYRTDYEEWKLETENGGPAYKTWDKEKLNEFKSIGDTNNSTFMEINELPSVSGFEATSVRKT